MKTKKVKALSEKELEKVLGGLQTAIVGGTDSIDVTSELASGGTTTDSGAYQAPPIGGGWSPAPVVKAGSGKG